MLAGDGPINLFLFDWDTAEIVTVAIGRLGLPAPETTLARPQFTVPGGTWAGALLANGTTWAMTGAQTTPAWDPRDSVMAAGALPWPPTRSSPTATVPCGEMYYTGGEEGARRGRGGHR